MSGNGEVASAGQNPAGNPSDANCTEPRPYTVRTSAGRYMESFYTVDFELLECGHRRKPKDNALLGGTDIGNAKKRRCVECAAPTSTDRAP